MTPQDLRARNLLINPRKKQTHGWGKKINHLTIAPPLSDIEMAIITRHSQSQKRKRY